MTRTLLLSALFLAFLTLPAAAQEVVPLPPPGHVILNLSVNEDTKLEQDTLSATLRYEVDGSAANDIQDRINKTVAEALGAAKAYTSVTTTTGGYYVYAYDEARVVDPRTGQAASAGKRWRGTQTVELESKDSTKLLELAGKIQSMGFVMGGLGYSLSPEKAESVQDELMQKALKALGDKAALAAKALGKSGYEMIDVNVNGSAPPAYPVYARGAMMKMESMAADVAAPVAQAGEASVSMNVSARVLLKP